MFKKKGKRIKFSERLKCNCDHFVSISIEKAFSFDTLKEERLAKGGISIHTN